MTQTTNESLYLQEAEEIKKRWHQYVYDTLTYLDSDIKKIREETKKDKEELSKKIDDLKSQLVDELNNLKSECHLLNTGNTELQSRVDAQINDIKNEIENYIDDKFGIFKEKIDVKIEDIKILSATTKTKVAVYSVVVGLILTAAVTTISGGILMVFGDAIKSFFGAG